jgi:hypothetical protein
MRPRDTITQAAKKQAAALERLTGEWFCQSGAHYTRAASSEYRNRRICLPCKARLAKLKGLPQ